MYVNLKLYVLICFLEVVDFFFTQDFSGLMQSLCKMLSSALQCPVCFNGSPRPFIKGSALKALNGDTGDYGVPAIKQCLGCSIWFPRRDSWKQCMVVSDGVESQDLQQHLVNTCCISTDIWAQRTQGPSKCPMMSDTETVETCCSEWQFTESLCDFSL